MVDFATEIAQRAQRFTYVAWIEGIGDANGLHAFTVNVPTVGVGNARYARRDTFAELPKVTPGRTQSIFGGMPEAGSVSLEMVDYADLLTAAMRTDAPPNSMLASAISATSTTIDLVDASSLPASGAFVWWTGAEAILIASRASNTLTVASGGRGFLGTLARSHAEGDLGYTTPPFVRTRLLSLFLASRDAASSADVESYLVGTYRVDSVSLGQKLGTYKISGASEERVLSRLVGNRMPFALRVQSVSSSRQVLWTPVPGADGAAGYGQTLGTWPDSMTYFANTRTREIFRASVTASTFLGPQIVARGEAATEEDSIEPGDILRPVLVADTIYGSVRWSPGPTPSTNRASGTWNVSANAVDILLAVLTSAAHTDDGIEMLNYDPAFGNWSSLPAGFGIGYRADRIDFESFLAVRARTPTYLLPSLAIGTGEETPTFAEWVTQNMLEPFGWFLVVVNGRLTLLAPRLLLEGETPEATLGVDDIIEMGEPERALDVVAGAVTYVVKGPRGAKHPITVRASDYTALFGGRAQYTVEDDPIEFDVPGISSAQLGVSAQVARMAQRILMRAVRAPWRVPLRVHGRHHALAHGSIIAITHPDLPDASAGTRGWSGVLAQVISAGPVGLGDGGATRKLDVLVYPGLRIGRVAPSAMIASVSGTGPWVCTCAANRYTAADAGAVLGLPDTDAEAFTATDRVKTIQRSGVDRTLGYTVTAVGTNTVTVSGSAAPLAGDVLVFDDYASTTTTQRTRYAQWSNDRNEVAVGVPPFRYGES